MLTPQLAKQIAHELEDKGIALYFCHPLSHSHTFYEPGRTAINQDGEEVSVIHQFSSADSVQQCLQFKLDSFRQ